MFSIRAYRVPTTRHARLFGRGSPLNLGNLTVLGGPFDFCFAIASWHSGARSRAHSLDFRLWNLPVESSRHTSTRRLGMGDFRYTLLIPQYSIRISVQQNQEFGLCRLSSAGIGRAIPCNSTMSGWLPPGSFLNVVTCKHVLYVVCIQRDNMTVVEMCSNYWQANRDPLGMLSRVAWQGRLWPGLNTSTAGEI
jgi:hypothetical protein